MIPKIEWTKDEDGQAHRAKFLGYELLVTRTKDGDDLGCEEYGGGGWWTPSAKARGRPRMFSDARSEHAAPLNIAKLEALHWALIDLSEAVGDKLDDVERANNEKADRIAEKKAVR